MQSEKLTDEQLWRAIAQNTNVMTALIHQLLELDPAINTLTDTIRQAKLRESNAERIGKLEGNYQEYTAELRRRVIRWNRADTAKPPASSQTGGFAFTPYDAGLGDAGSGAVELECKLNAPSDQGAYARALSPRYAPSVAVHNS